MTNPNERTIDDVMEDIDTRLENIERGGDSTLSANDMAEVLVTSFNPMLETLTNIYDSMLDYFNFQKVLLGDENREQAQELFERKKHEEALLAKIDELERNTRPGEEKGEKPSSVIAAAFKKLTGGPIKGLAGLSRLLFRFGGPLAMIGAIISFADGFRNAEAIVGKGGLSVIERVGAGAANIVKDVMNLLARIANFFLPENLRFSADFNASEIYQGIANLFGKLMDLLRWIDVNVMDPIRNGIGWVITNLMNLDIRQMFTDLAEDIQSRWDGLKAGFQQLKTDTANMIDNITSSITGAATDVFNIFLSIPGRIKDFVFGIYDRIFDMIGFETSFTELSQMVFDGIKDFVTSIFDRIVGFVEDIRDAILGVFDSVRDSIRSRLESLTDFGGRIKGFFGGDDEPDVPDQSVFVPEDNPDLSTDAIAASIAASLDRPTPQAQQTQSGDSQINSNNSNVNMTNNNNTVMTSPVSGGNPDSYSRFLNAALGPNRFSY